MPLYSHSRLSTYESCPLRYRYRYIDRVRTGVETVEAFLGTRVHETLERLYRKRRSGALPDLPGLLSYYESRWERLWHPRIRIVRTGRTEAEYNQVGRDCIRSYYQRFVPFDQVRTVALEHRLILRLDGDGQYKMQGIIDRISEAPDGTLEIHDYKTSERLPSRSALDRDRQLALYQIAVGQRWPEARDVVLVWHYLRHGETFTSRRSPEDLESLRQETIGRIREIEQASEFPPRESPLCAWCEYTETCPVWEGRPPPWPV